MPEGPCVAVNRPRRQQELLLMYLSLRDDIYPFHWYIFVLCESSRGSSFVLTRVFQSSCSRSVRKKLESWVNTEPAMVLVWESRSRRSKLVSTQSTSAVSVESMAWSVLLLVSGSARDATRPRLEEHTLWTHHLLSPSDLLYVVLGSRLRSKQRYGWNRGYASSIALFPKFTFHFLLIM